MRDAEAVNQILEEAADKREGRGLTTVYMGTPVEELSKKALIEALCAMNDLYQYTLRAGDKWHRAFMETHRP